MTYSTQQRKERILAKLHEHGHVAVKDLAVEMQISEATVRRDLKVLADENELMLVYGGASLAKNFYFSFHSKAMRNVEAKRSVGRLAATLVGDEEQIFLDSGTTSFEMAPFLKGKRGLAVIVNSARLVGELSSVPGINIITLGGHYRPDRMDTTGPLATTTLDQLRGYIAFIGADGLSMDFGPTASDVESAHLFRLAVRHARESILLVDHTKFQTPSLYKIVEWSSISKVVTDLPPAAEWVEFLKSRDIELVVPPAPTEGLRPEPIEITEPAKGTEVTENKTI